ncbi:MAG: cyclic lactone autoinducer peptide [Clostridia bacterium]|nr:cyclic lactone autoinducer peptide [Clostridia bacterium]NCC44195.1 cyclic lactone autoinducer peptide [Clostridia bacterium]
MNANLDVIARCGNMKRKVCKIIVEIAKQMVRIDVKTTCPWICYQPKIPDSVQKLRKEYEAVLK